MALTQVFTNLFSMSRIRISMQDIRRILCYYYGKRYSKRQIATYLGVSPGTVRNYLRRAEAAGLCWPVSEDLTDAALASLLFPARDPSPGRPQPDWPEVHQQLARKGMTLERIWHVWIQENPTGYSYGHFCACYKQWCRSRKVTMRLEHKAGDPLYVDFAGKTIPVIDPMTGEVTPAQIFVATLGCSQYTYVEAVPDQRLRSWIGAHVRCLEFFGALPILIVCDNLKAAVSRAFRKHPELNPTYVDFARHYGLILAPARVRKPQDKSVVELAVKFVTSRILTSLETREFFSMEELNQAIRPLLDKLNDHPFQKRPGSRRSQFQELDLPAMRPLPAERYMFRVYKVLKASFDYHIQTDGCYYSVPNRYAHQKIDVWISEHTVDCFYQCTPIATHVRLWTKGSKSTNPNHMPRHHRWYQDRERFLAKARAMGPNTLCVVEAMLDRPAHQEQAFRSITGILQLQERYGRERLEAACAIARSVGEKLYKYPSIASILKTGRDQHAAKTNPAPSLWHENIRGADYYR